MAGEKKQVRTVEVDKELHACPDCDYDRGFHVAFVRQPDGQSLRVELICPSCGSRYNLNRMI